MGLAVGGGSLGGFSLPGLCLDQDFFVFFRGFRTELEAPLFLRHVSILELQFGVLGVLFGVVIIELYSN